MKAFDLTYQKKRQSQDDESHQKRNNNGKNNTIFILLLVVVVFIIIIDKSSDNKSKKSNQNTTVNAINQNQSAKNQEEIQTNNQITSSSSINDQNTPSESTVEDSSQNAEQITNKSTIKIKILNGSKVSGLAQEAKTKLEDDGYKIDSIGTAKNFYQKTVIYYATGKENYATEIQLALGNQGARLELNDSLVGAYDLLIVIGKEWKLS